MFFFIDLKNLDDKEKSSLNCKLYVIKCKKTFFILLSPKWDEGGGVRDFFDDLSYRVINVTYFIDELHALMGKNMVVFGNNKLKKCCFCDQTDKKRKTKKKIFAIFQYYLKEAGKCGDGKLVP